MEGLAVWAGALLMLAGWYAAIIVPNTYLEATQVRKDMWLCAQVIAVTFVVTGALLWRGA